MPVPVCGIHHVVEHHLSSTIAVEHFENPCLSTVEDSKMPHPEERLPDPAPFPLFFLPNFLGIVFALGTEKLGIEERFAGMISEGAHQYCLLGLGVFLIAMANSYLGGSVVLGRIEYGVKLPNLYAAKTHNKNAVLFNCIQRGHQNFLENYGQIILSVFFTAFVAERPNVAGVMLISISLLRVLYAVGYKTNISSRIGPLLLSQFLTSIGIGYGALIGLSTFGVKTLKEA